MAEGEQATADPYDDKQKNRQLQQNYNGRNPEILASSDGIKRGVPSKYMLEAQSNERKRMRGFFPSATLRVRMSIDRLCVRGE
jgi:hypothetical protein